MNIKSKIGAAALAAAAVVSVSACQSKSDVASHNLSQAADNFHVDRRVVFYNGITGKYILEIDGLCSVNNNADATHNAQVSVTCETSPGVFEKHLMGLSDNVTWFEQQINPQPVSDAHYRIQFMPSTMLPDVDVR